MIRRLPDPNDRRGVQVELTETSRALWERAVDLQAAKEKMFAQPLTPEEKEISERPPPEDDAVVRGAAVTDTRAGRTALAPPSRASLDSPLMAYLTTRSPEPPVAGGTEADTLLGSSSAIRATFEWKCGGLDAAGLQATVGDSSITLGGLLKHLALVEDYYFSKKLFGRDLGSPWDAGDWDADPDWEWHSAADDSPEELMTLWKEAVARSRAAVDEALSDRRPRSIEPVHRMDGTAEPASSPDRPDRGVRPSRRPRRSHPGIGRRARR